MITHDKLNAILNPLNLSSIDTTLVTDAVNAVSTIGQVEQMLKELKASGDLTKAFSPNHKAAQALNLVLNGIRGELREPDKIKYNRGDVVIDSTLSEADQLIQIKANQEAAWGKENIAENEAIFKSREEQAARYAAQDEAKFTSKPDPHPDPQT